MSSLMRAQHYFSELGRLLAATEVTNSSGESLDFQEATDRAAQFIHSLRQRSGVVAIIGNGGSSAIASHMQNDLVAASLRAVCMHDPAILSATANDFGYERSFERPMNHWVQKGDVLIAISSSGQSHNILNAVQKASQNNGYIITMSGFKKDNPLRQLGDLNFYVPDAVYGTVESVHGCIGHYLTDLIQQIAQMEV
ncbi:D-sedoheptulose-7-phosphate isomerase [Desulfovibrio inopinatus]|uniref:D-sedoheptulose-7-phosphate isomerase n=1 Tax=Desulfovibrio inopinatus TaxID=102109 RepID=UPI0004295662|nr:SIS domain-containing protein [Desulfovibrio inopinatus]